MPVDLLGLTAIEGIGPKKVLAFWKSLGVRSVADLRRGWAEKKHVIDALSAERMLAALKRAGKRARSRISVAAS